MNKSKKLKNLIKRRNVMQAEKQAAILKINEYIQSEYNKVFDKNFSEVLSDLETSNEYGSDENGIYHWIRCYDLKDIPKEDREFFETWVNDYACAYVEWENDAIKAYDGDSITIQDDTQHDNGVWLGHKFIIDESEYLDDYEQVDETKRNALIEAYMERTGYFPGVFKVDSCGNVFPVNTKE